MSFRGCLSEGVDIFLKSVEHQGESGHDVRVSRLTPWMASVGGPVIMKKTYSLFVENSHPETLHRGRMFRSPWAFVDLKLPFAMSHTIHKIVSIKRCQSYFISRRSPHLGISKDSELCASAHRCLYLCLCAAHCSRNFLFRIMSAAHISRGIHSGKRSIPSGSIEYYWLSRYCELRP